MAADGLRNALPGLSVFPPLPIELKGARFGVQVFTSNGTFQRPSGVSSVTAMAICVGGGGGGGGGYGNSAGTLSSGGGGSNGGASSIGTLASASGGLGGDAGTGAAPTEQGATGYQRGSFGRYARTESSPNVSWVGSPSTGGRGLFGFGHGGEGGSAIIVNLAGATGSGGNGGNSGAVATYFGTISADESIAVGTGGAGGMGGVFGTLGAGQRGAGGVVVIFYWW
jgi:hypothetical protein